MRGLIAFTLAAPLLLGLTGCERAKTKLDREVDRLCAIDGGVHVYETVKLTKENFGPNGEVFPQYRDKQLTKGRLGANYVAQMHNKVIVSGDPALERINIIIIRASDGRRLGELVIYRRSGGDIPGPWESSRYSCPIGPVFNLEGQIFKLKEE